MIQWTGIVESRKLKVIKKSSQKIVLRREISRVEGDGREGEVLQTLGLQGGADILGVPVPDRLDQEHGGRDESPGHQHSPDDPGGPGLTPVDVGQAVHAGGGEEIIQLPPEVLKVSGYHGSITGTLIKSFYC